MKKPLSNSLRTFYGIGDFGFSLMTSVELYLFVFFLTNVAKFSVPVVALIGSVTSIVDAVLSPFYGAIISGTKPLKWGRNRSWLFVSPPLVVLLYVFQFTKIGPEPLAAFIVCAGFILSHIVWNIGWVANVALIPVLASTPDERSLLASRRGTWTSLAGIVYSYIGSPLALYLGVVTKNEVMGYSLLAGFMAFVMMLGYWTVFKLTDGYEPTDEGASAGKKPVSLGVMFKSLVHNPPLIVLLIADFFRYMANFVMTAAAAFYFTYVAQDMSLFPKYLLFGSIAQVVGSYISANVAKALSSRNATIYGLFGLAVSLFFCKFVATNITMFFIVVMVARLFLGILASVMVSLYSDTSVYSQWKVGEDASAFVMGLMTLSLKTAVISRGTVVPLVLAASGFVSGIDPASATPELINAVNNVFLFIPGVFTLVGAVVMAFGYKLTREKLVEYQKEIESRKAEAAGVIG